LSKFSRRGQAHVLAARAVILPTILEQVSQLAFVCECARARGV
jgi:hypothetical protein